MICILHLLLLEWTFINISLLKEDDFIFQIISYWQLMVWALLNVYNSLNNVENFSQIEWVKSKVVLYIIS